MPTSFSPLSVNATIDGVVRAPSAFSITFAAFPSMTATQLFVVPRSIPMTSPPDAADEAMLRTLIASAKGDDDADDAGAGAAAAAAAAAAVLCLKADDPSSTRGVNAGDPWIPEEVAPVVISLAI